jgi:hypothetical protein
MALGIKKTTRTTRTPVAIKQTMAEAVTALTAAVGKMAAASAATALAGSALLNRNVAHAKAMSTMAVVQEEVVMDHATHGAFLLRMVAMPDGSNLIGVVDEHGATYCECEHHDSQIDAEAAWADWLEALVA